MSIQLKPDWILAILILLIVLSLSLTGCSIGVKEQTHIVYAGFAKEPEEINGAIRIATNKKIPVTIIGVKDTSSVMDLGGMIAVREADLVKLVRIANGTSPTE